MCSLLDGLDEILDDAFFDELTRLAIEEDDGPTLNEFLASQKENCDDIINKNTYTMPMNNWIQNHDSVTIIDGTHII